MPRVSKRAKTTTVTADDTESVSASEHAQPQLFIPFQTGPSLEHIPDDILLEILIYLPTLSEAHVVFGHRLDPPVIPSTSLVRTPTLRAMSQTSRLLRSRCIAMAWQRVELCGASIPQHNFSFYRAIGEATKTAIGVLTACPHLWPLIQTVSVVFTRYQSAEIIPAFAACLAMLPNLTTIQVVHAHSQMTTPIKNGVEGKTFPSVRKITLPCSAHEIIKSCPNLEQVTCTEGDGSTIVGSLVKGNCTQVRVIRGIHAPLTRLVKLLPNLKHVATETEDMRQLARFPFLDTIEITIHHTFANDVSLPDIVSSEIKNASNVLRENKSHAEKTVLLTKWNVMNHEEFAFDLDSGRMVKEAIKV